MKKLIVTIAFVIIATASVTFSYAKTSRKSTIVLCDGKYALCSSAQCIPNPQNPVEAICFCEVYNGKSLGHSSCKNRIPSTDRNGNNHVISTFSFEGSATKKVMTCPSGKPWTDCMDQPCVVDPLDPKKAICSCKIIRTGAFQTFGGDCDLSTCNTGYWSAATIDSSTQFMSVLSKALGFEKPPQKFCPK